MWPLFKSFVKNFLIFSILVYLFWIGINYILPITTEYKTQLLCDYQKYELIAKTSLYSDKGSPSFLSDDEYQENQQKITDKVGLLCDALKNQVDVERTKENNGTWIYRYLVSEKYLAHQSYQLKYVKFNWRYVLSVEVWSAE